MLKLLYRKRDYCIILDTLTDTKYSMHKHDAYTLVNSGIIIDGLRSLNNKTKEKKYAFVEDIRGVKLSPTHTNNAWKLVCLDRAKLISKEPMKIRLLREQDNTDTCEIRFGIDPGDTTGVVVMPYSALTQLDAHRLAEQVYDYNTVVKKYESTF